MHPLVSYAMGSQWFVLVKWVTQGVHRALWACGVGFERCERYERYHGPRKKFGRYVVVTWSLRDALAMIDGGRMHWLYAKRSPGFWRAIAPCNAHETATRKWAYVLYGDHVLTYFCVQ